jgi:hypothetical protein
MSKTLINGVENIASATIVRSLINTATTGSALITKVVAGTNVTFSSTGTDAGTGDVTINSSDASKAPLASPTFTGTVTMPAGTLTVVPLKLTSGTNLTTPIAGAMEYDGSNLYFSPTAIRKRVLVWDRTNVSNTAYTILATDNNIQYITLTANRNASLPVASSVVAGKQISVGDSSGNVSIFNSLTVVRNGTDTINSAASNYIISSPYGQVTLESDGVSNWLIVSGTQFASLASPAFTGVPTAPTPAGSDNSTTIATTAFVAGSFAKTVSPTFTGTVTMSGGSTILAPIKLTAGSNLTTPIAGAMEYDGTNLYFSPTALRKIVSVYDRITVADTAYTVLATDNNIQYTSLSTARIVTLPAASALTAGKFIIIGDASGSCSASNTLTITRAGTDTISGMTTYVINTAYGQVNLQSDGVGKWVIESGSQFASTAFVATNYIPVNGTVASGNTVTITGGLAWNPTSINAGVGNPGVTSGNAIPFSAVASGFSVWSDYTSTNTGVVSTATFIRNVDGSGTFGPSYADIAAMFSTQKHSYLTSAVEGELDTLYVVARQGKKGDVLGIGIDVQKVRTGTGDTGAPGMIEGVVKWIDTSGNALQSQHLIMGFAESTGGESAGQGYGYSVEARGGTWFAAYQVGAFHEETSLGTYGYRFVMVASKDPATGPTTRSNTATLVASEYFRIVGDIPDSGYSAGDIIQGVPTKSVTLHTDSSGNWSLNNSSNVSLFSVSQVGTVQLSSATSPAIIINKSVTGLANQLVGATNGVSRWNIYIGDTTAEVTNAGSDFKIGRYNDSGTLQDYPIFISRLTGIVTFISIPLVPTATAGDNSTKSATTAFVATAVASYLPLTGGTLSSNLTISNVSPVLILSKSTGDNQIIGQVGGSARWLMKLGNNTTESGSNVGSDFVIARYNDSGTFQDNPIFITRSTGVVNFSAIPTHTTPTAGDNSTKSATTAFVATSFVALSGGTMTGSLILNYVSPILVLNKTLTGQSNQLAGYTNSVSRWLMALGNTTAESANAGSDFSLSRYNDSGTLLDAPILIPRLTGIVQFLYNPTYPTASAGDNSTKGATTAYVDTGLALKSNLASPTFTGVPAAPTAAVSTNTTQIATTAFVLANSVSTVSPAFTGTPTAPTAAVSTNTTQLATTAFVLGQVATVAPLIDGTATVGTSLLYARQDHVHPTDTTRAALAGPTFTGLTTTGYLRISAPNVGGMSAATLNTNIGIANTGSSAFTWNLSGGNGELDLIVNRGGGSIGGFQILDMNNAGTTVTQILRIDANGNHYSFGTHTLYTGTATVAPLVFVSGTNLTTAIAGAMEYDGTNLYFTPLTVRRTVAFLDSPTFTGTPSAPTAALSTNTTQIATTAFVLANSVSTASPAFTGTPTAPTAATSTNTTQLATTAFVRNASLIRYVYVSDYGAVGDGTTDDTTALTNFINHAIANPGVPHVLGPLRYKITSALPTISTSGVIILGSGSDIHDNGSVLSGTVIVYAGSAGATMLSVASVGGAAQRVSNVQIVGVGFDCNSLAAYGLYIVTVRDSIFDIATSNATTAALYVGCLGTALGGGSPEARDTQDNRFRIVSRQVESNGYAVYVTGNAVANTSMNDFHCDVEHYNSTAVYLVNSDNNTWWIRASAIAGGTAAYGVECLGNATSAAQACRNEVFQFYTCNPGKVLPIKIWGTGTYTYPSIAHTIFYLDVGNGAPLPTIDTGASCDIAAMRSRFVYDLDYGAVGDGSTDDTTALTNFWNHAIANPGVPHLLRPLTYKITSPMPSIAVSGVIIRGTGSDIHDNGSILSGTVLSYLGTSTTSVVTITSTAGTAQRVSYVEFSGIGINCNSLSTYGLTVRSIRNSIFNLATANANTAGVYMSVISGTLSGGTPEAKDTQRNTIRLIARQIDGTGGPTGAGLICDGDTTANVSMNDFWVDCQHTNTAAIKLVNCDNNQWRFIRTVKAAGGTATDAVSCLGSNTNAVLTARNNTFFFHTGNLPIHVYGTGTYTYPSLAHIIEFTDAGNGTPAPVIDSGATSNIPFQAKSILGDTGVDVLIAAAGTNSIGFSVQGAVRWSVDGSTGNIYPGAANTFSIGAVSTSVKSIYSMTYTAGAGTATVAPLKLTSGTNLTTAAAGSMEYDGASLYFTPLTNRQTVALTYSLTRTLPTTLNNEVDIGSFNFTWGASSLQINIVVPSSGYSMTKQYTIPIWYNATANTWTYVLPDTNTGPFGSNDIALDILVNATNVSLRIRNTGGSTAGTAYITMTVNGVNTDVFTPSIAFSSVPVSPPTAFYSAGNVISQGLYGVGFGLINANALLHISGGSTTIAAMKFVAGSLLTTPAAGAVEYDGFNIYFTPIASARKTFVLTDRIAVADAAYTALITDNNIQYTSITAARVLTLPSAATMAAGDSFWIGDSSGSCSATNTITITRAGTDTINGGTTYVLNTAFGQTRIQSDGAAKWTIIGGSQFATLASPTFTGVPAAPTAAVNTNTTQLATTQFVVGQAGSASPLVNGVTAIGSSLLYARQDHVHPTDATRAALASPTFTGTVTLPTGTAAVSPINWVSGTVLTTPVAGSKEYDGVVFYATPAASARHVMKMAQFVQLTASYTLTSQTAAQKLFNATASGTLTLAIGTYYFNGWFGITGMSTTSGSFGFALGGTATFTQAWTSSANKVATGTSATAASGFTTSNTAANTSLVTANVNPDGYAYVEGVIRVTVAGTLIPQISLTVAAAAVIAANSFFHLHPMGAAAVSNIGRWS